VAAASNARDGLFEANRHYWDLAVLDLHLGTESGLEWLTALRGAFPGALANTQEVLNVSPVFQNAMI
jgi:ActR/RegA family two-component response regulator